MKTTSAVAAALFMFCGCDCSHDHGHGEGHVHSGECRHSHGHGHENAQNSPHVHGECREAKSVRVAPAVQRVIGLETVKAVKRDVSSLLLCPGRYELLPDARERVSTPVAGRLDILVRPLAKVKKGDALFTVTSPDLVARSREISVLSKRLEVYREIKTRNAALENELDVKRAARSSLLAGAEEKDGVVTVRAGVDGLVDAFLAKSGDWLGTGAAALEVVRPGSLRFKALVAAADAGGLKDGLRAQVGALSGEVRLGVGDDSGLVPVYVVFKGEVDAIAGARGEATVFTGGGGEPKTAVPSECVVSIGLQPTVFVRDAADRGRFIAVDVTPLESAGGWTAVDGLPSDGVEVVSKGAYELKLALPGGGNRGAGHFHADGTFHEGEH